MAFTTKHEIVFDPPIPAFNGSRAGKPLTCLAGANNTGKSLVLKYLKQQMGRSAYLIGPNRFYHVYQFNSGVRSPTELDEFERQFNQTFSDDSHNHENNFFDLNRIIIGLTNAKRAQLFELCGELLGCTLTLKKLDENNELSTRYVDMDGQNIAVGSTGTRLLMTILGICMDDRFSTILIDEPELGLSPRVQQSLVSFLVDPSERSKFFPHLANVYVATHSHVFLNRADIESNFIVSKSGANIALTQVKTVSDLHRLQFNLLGNSLEALYLPSAIFVTEGTTDADFVERVLGVHHPERRITVTQSGGDPKRRIQALREAFGELSRSPMRPRIFVVLDSIHRAGLVQELVAMGVPKENVIVWDKNGIEFVYPPSLVGAIFACDPDRSQDIVIDNDSVSLGANSFKKNELCREVLKRLDGQTALSEEFERKLMEPLRSVLE